MVFFRGSMIDLDKLHSQLEESKKAAADLQARITETEADIEKMMATKAELETRATKDQAEIETLQAQLDHANSKFSQLGLGRVLG